MMGTIAFFVILALVLFIGALIPTILSKMFMKMVFGRTVSFGMVMLAMVLCTIFTMAALVAMVWYAHGPLDLQKLEGLEDQFTAGENVLAWLFGFVLQVLLLSFMVTDQNFELISSWKWAVVTVLQYLAVIAIVVAIAMVMVTTSQAATLQTIIMV